MTDSMKNERGVIVLIPARNEILSIVGVIENLPGFVTEVVVADNGSSDGTGEAAREAGATVVRVEEPGYGRACMAAYAASTTPRAPDDIIVFMDADASDDPADMAALIAPIRDGSAQLVIGSRALGEREPGALTPQQRFGNALACWLMKLIWGARFTDLGPFRAVRRDAYESLDMSAPTFGWTVEMQVRALKRSVPYAEVPARYRKRIGVSKISGTVRGVVMAGVYILGTIAAEAVRRD